MISSSGRAKPIDFTPTEYPTPSSASPPSSTATTPTRARMRYVRSSSMWSPNDMRVSAKMSSG